ncbi:WD40 repeat domain-containing serine/threonine-protein kinase [Actinocorallia libanotica]|uniref:WD40 repeat protein n=1 Tax=Actinocorallia libanotica TaxID=46162 RepID=A0ABN1R819_9ACTN
MAEKTEPLLPDTAVLVAPRSLEQAVREEGRLPVPSVAWVGALVASALAGMHATGDAHGDVSPGSILQDGERVVLGPGLTEAGRPEEDLRRLGESLRYAVEGHHHDDSALISHAGPLQPLIEELLSHDPSLRPTAAQAADRLLALLHAPAPAPRFLTRRRLLGLGATGVLAATVPPASFLLLDDEPDGPPALTLLGHLTQNGFFMLGFNPTSKALATIGNPPDHGEFRLWNMDTFTQIGQTLTDSDYLSGLAFTPDGLTLAIGFGSRVHLWNTTTGARTGAILDQGPYTVFSLAFSPDGRRLAVGCEESMVNLWDVEQRVRIKGPLHHGLPVSSLSFSPDGRLLASGGCSGEKLGWAVLWDTETHTQVGERLRHEHWVTRTKLSPDGRLLATSCFDGEVRFWDVETRALTASFHHPHPVHGLAFTPDGRLLVTADRNSDLRLWDTAKHTAIGRPVSGSRARILFMDLSPDGRTLAVGTDLGSIHLWRLTS